jgi:c-di-GMP-binding flagellar brake protein YcgR
MNDVEKRRHHRFLALLEMRVGPGENIPADLKLTTIDISSGGARCASNRPLDADLSLKVTLSLVGGDPRGPAIVEVEARVLRSKDRPHEMPNRRYEISLQFTHVEAEDRKRLQAYLNGL